MLSRPLACSSDHIRIHKIEDARLQLTDSDIKSILDDEEYFIWKNYAQKPHKQAEWLRGRLVLKEVIASTLLNQNFNISLRDIHIRQNELCCPYYIFGGLTHQSISLSHARGSSIACISTQQHHIGIDYEIISERNPGKWLERAFHDRELELFCDRDFVTLLGYWTAKEAASKANGTGLRDGWRNWQVTQTLDDSELVIHHANENFHVKTYKLNDELISVCLKPN